MNKNVAVLLTCYNRKNTTIECLISLFNQDLVPNIKLEVYLVDDGSSDGTSVAIKELFPQVNIIQGNGNLYWNGGMRLAWEVASGEKDYDFYLWLNDDVVLTKDSLVKLFFDFEKLIQEVILVGIIKEPNQDFTSYSGYIGSLKLDPINKIQECETFNGNVVLIPKAVFQKVGLLDKSFSQNFGDTDYGWRANKKGIKCYVTSNYIAEGCVNPKGSEWANPKNGLFKRLRLLHSPKGLPPKEWYVYARRVYGKKWVISFVKLYLRALFPTFWNTMKKKMG